MLAALAALVVVATSAHLAHLEEGEKALAALEYETAAYELMLAATDPAATDEQRLKANLLAGVAHRVLGRDTEARVNFRYVLLRAPGTKLDASTSPKVLLFFESVRQEMEAERAFARSTDVPPQAPAPSAPAPAPPQGARMSTPAMAGAVIGVVGVAVLLGAAGGVTLAETSLADPERLANERAGLRTVGQWSVAGLGAGALLTAVGGVLVVVGGEP